MSINPPVAPLATLMTIHTTMWMPGSCLKIYQALDSHSPVRTMLFSSLLQRNGHLCFQFAVVAVYSFIQAVVSRIRFSTSITLAGLSSFVGKLLPADSGSQRIAQGEPP